MSAGALCATAAYIAGWSLIGDLSTVPESADPDFMVEAPELPAAGRLLFGAAAVVASVALVVLHLVPGAPFALSRRRALVPIVLLGAYLAFFARTLTAGVIGANIGGGMLMIFVTPWLVPLLLFITARLDRAGRPEPG